MVARRFESLAMPACSSRGLPDTALGQIGDVVEQVFDRAEPLQQIRGGLLADARHAGDVIGRVALEAFVVGHLLRGKSEALDHFFGPVDHGIRHALDCGHHPHVFVHQLKRIEVAGDYCCLQALFGRCRGKSADHVVRLVALDLYHRYIERADHLSSDRPLGDKIIMRRGAVRFVPEYTPHA